ncbi:MAG: hypothetical protein RDA78_14770 [Roseibium sp.]|uniref:hypothetical protein n=1 Tax=Roseibium sp. TaxID=1936156 RepID=UPI003D9C095A
MLRMLIFSLLSLACLNPALAFVQLDGCFLAEKTCEAFQSKNRKTNPGEVMHAAEPMRMGCRRGIVDPAGLQ